MISQTLPTPAIAPRLVMAPLNFLAALAKGIAFASGAQARFDEIQRLQSLSDAELARLGLARDAIVRHVYRDLLAQ